ncbi:MAG: hypothetical protein LBT00_11275 [Spirochaetaceae bacterium]|nr:hypothetical protein [Spirochaetaceae bacterium]
MERVLFGEPPCHCERSEAIQRGDLLRLDPPLTATMLLRQSRGLPPSRNQRR